MDTLPGTNLPPEPLPGSADVPKAAPLIERRVVVMDAALWYQLGLELNGCIMDIAGPTEATVAALRKARQLYAAGEKFDRWTNGAFTKADPA